MNRKIADVNADVEYVAAQLVALFAESDWLPHGAIVTQVFGDKYRIEVKLLEPNTIPDEEWVQVG